CLRLAREYPAVKFIEIDTQESQRFKTAAFTTHKVPLPDNLEFLEGDLQHPLAQIMAPSRHHDAGAKTLWIAEGFFMFIPEASVRQIFEAARQLSSNGSHLLFTSLPHKRITSPVG